jgi:hypothetical protein
MMSTRLLRVFSSSLLLLFQLFLCSHWLSSILMKYGRSLIEFWGTLDLLNCLDLIVNLAFLSYEGILSAKLSQGINFATLRLWLGNHRPSWRWILHD